jgi:hypothetical protein
MESASLRYGPAMDSGGPFSLSHSFERHLRAKDLSDGTVASYLVGVRQFTAFLQPRGRELEEASRADLEAFIAELLTSRSARPPRLARRRWRWIATSASELGTGTRPCHGCGWGSRAS